MHCGYIRTIVILHIVVVVVVVVARQPSCSRVVTVLLLQLLLAMKMTMKFFQSDVVETELRSLVIKHRGRVGRWHQSLHFDALVRNVDNSCSFTINTPFHALNTVRVYY